MAFKPEKLTVVPKGLNLVSPGDQLADGDCLELTGWWPGSLGRLQQGRGWLMKNTATVGDNLDTLDEVQGRVYYAGGGALFQIGRDTAGASIDTGYDGFPLGTCGYQDQLWMMNRSKQTRDDGGVAGLVTMPIPWGVEVPVAPTPVAATGGGLTDGQQTYYITFVDLWGYESNPSPPLNVVTPYNATVSGTAAVYEGSATITASLSAWTISVVGMQFRAFPDANIIYTITGVSGLIGGGPYYTTATISPAFYGASNSAAEYEISSPANTGKVTLTRTAASTPERIAGWNVYRLDAASTTASVYQINTTPLPYSTGSLQPNQTSFTVFVDYGDQGHGQDLDTLILNDQVMDLDHDPAPAARVLARIPYNGRMVVANSAAYPNRIWYSPALQPHYFPGSGNPQAGNWVDVGNDPGDEIWHISVKNGYLLIYRQRSIWQLTSDFADPNSTLVPLVPNMGIVGPRAVISTSTGDIAVVKQGLQFGLYRVTDWEQRISQRIEPILNGLGSECYLAMNTATETYAWGTAPATFTCALGYQLGRLWFTYPDGTNAYPNRALIYDVEQDTFSYTVSGRWFSRAGSFGCFLHGSLFFLAGGQGIVYSLEDGSGGEATGVGTSGNTALAYQSAYLDCGNPDHEKTWGDLVLSHNTGGQTWTIIIRTNKGTGSWGGGTGDSFTLITISSSVLTRQEIPLLYPVAHANAGLPIESCNLSVRITGNGPKTFPGAFVDGPILLHYYLKPRKATSWDSGPTDHGQTCGKFVDAFEIDVDCAGAMTLFYQTDFTNAGPSGILTERSPGGLGIAIAATSGRQVSRFMIGTVAGRILRYQLYANDTTKPFLLYKFRPRILPLGTFVDGSMQDTWFTEPVTP